MDEPAPKAPRAIDWPATKRKIEAAIGRLEAGGTLTAEAARKILRERAIKFAPAPQAADDGERIEILAFTVAGAAYAIERAHCEAVTACEELCYLPGVPSFYLGVLSHGGGIFPIIDLPALIGGSGGEAPRARYAVLIHGDASLGIAATAITGLMTISAASIARSGGDANSSGIVTGVLADGTLLLDAQRLMADSRLQINEEPMLAVQNKETRQ